MGMQQDIDGYMASQPEAKRNDMQALHDSMLKLLPKARLWFLDGKDEKGKVVSNPNIGYGVRPIHYADGKSKEFYQISISGNTTGISVYIMGIEDKKYLPHTYGKQLGKASVTGYCIKFKKLSDIDLGVLHAAIKDGVAQTG